MGSIISIKAPSSSAAAFVRQLASTYGTQLQRHLMRMLGRRELAEEVAQETYLKLYRLCRPEEVHCAQALLFDVGTKLAITHLRRLRAEATLAASDAELASVPDESPQPDRRAMVDDAMRQLAQAVEQLPPSLRQVFVMRYIQHLPRQEIADHLQISVNAVEQRLTRALSTCRGRLAALGIDGFGLD